MIRAGRVAQNAPGFALLVVLWSLVLIGAIGIYLIANARIETAIAHNSYAAASAEALADAGVVRAAFNEMDPVSSNRWKTDGTRYRVSTRSGQVEIGLEDETTKINPNHASDTLLAALFEVSGVDHIRARSLGAAVADWVGPDGDPREFGAKLDQYRAAGRSYGPPNAPVESLDELQLVLGMTPQILSAVRPYLTIYTSSDHPNLVGAPPTIQKAVTLASENTENADASGADAGGTETQTPDANAPQAAEDEDRILSVEAIGYSKDGGVFARCATFRLDPTDPKGYVVLDWRRCVLSEATAKSSSAPSD